MDKHVACEIDSRLSAVKDKGLRKHFGLVW